MTAAIIDADSILYESAWQGEFRWDWDGDGEITVTLSPEVAASNLRSRIQTIVDACHAREAIVALSCPSRRYWRHDIWPSYKSHRKGSEPPALLSHVREYLVNNYETVQWDTLEADDVVGILATMPDTGPCVVVSGDKDLLQIPGRHLNPGKLEHGIFEVTPDEGDYWHLFQTLVGDSTDGYPGCPPMPSMLVDGKRIRGKRGVGAKTAPRYIERGWSGVVEAFIERGLTEQDALTQARVARILQADDWDMRKKEVRLWSPTRQ